MTERIGSTLGQVVIEQSKHLPVITQPALAARSTTLQVPFHQVTPEQVADARAVMEKFNDSSTPFLTKVAAVRTLDLAGRGPLYPMEVQVFRLDADTAIVCLPCEIFVELGLAIKQASPFKQTLVIEICNDRPSYVPTLKAFGEGSYEVTNARVKPGAGEMLVDAAVKLLKQLKPNEARGPGLRLQPAATSLTPTPASTSLRTSRLARPSDFGLRPSFGFRPSAFGFPPMTSANPSRPLSAGLLPTLGLFTTMMLVIGGVIGSGIFRKPGVMAAQVGSPELLLGVWVLAGVITLFGALTNAEIASMIPETGGQYIYFERMYGPFFAFLYGWAIFAVMQCGSIAAVAYVFAEYATQFVRLPEFPAGVAAWSFHVPFVGDVTPLKEIGIKGLAAALIVLLTAINYVGVRFGGLVQNIFTVAKVAAMLLLVLGAFCLPTGGAVANLTTPSAAHSS